MAGVDRTDDSRRRQSTSSAGISSRNREAGKALMVLSIDTPASVEVLAQLREGVDDAFIVGLGA